MEFAEINKTLNRKQRADMRRNPTEMIKLIVAEGKGFKTVKKNISQGRFQITGILEARKRIVKNSTPLANQEAINN